MKEGARWCTATVHQPHATLLTNQRFHLILILLQYFPECDSDHMGTTTFYQNYLFVKEIGPVL